MSQPTEELVRARAHELWTEAGNPEGRSDEFWHQAEQESGNEDKSSPCGRRTNSASSPVDFSGSPRRAASYKLSPVAPLGAETNSKAARRAKSYHQANSQIQSRSANHCNDKGRVDSSFRRRSPHSKRDRHLWLSARAHVLNSGSSLYLWLSATGAVLNGG